MRMGIYAQLSVAYERIRAGGRNIEMHLGNSGLPARPDPDPEVIQIPVGIPVREGVPINTVEGRIVGTQWTHPRAE